MRWSVAGQTAGFGAISGAATWIVLALWLGDSWDALSGPPLLQTAAVWAVVIMLLVPVWGIVSGVTGSPRLWPHLLVPGFLPLIVGIGVLGGSQWRDPVETTAAWAGFAVAAHLLVALAIGRGWRWCAALAGVLVVLLAGLVGFQVVSQDRWFVAQLRERGLRPVVPVTAGFHADGVNLGRFTLVVRMSDGHGRSFLVGIHRAGTPCGDQSMCTGDLVAYGFADQIPAGTTLRPVPGSALARLDRIAETTEAY
jgi:hypothetical protein